MKNRPTNAEYQKKRKKGRGFDVLVALLLVFGILAALVLNILYNRTNYTAEFYQTSSKRLTHGIRMVFLTDLHLREYGQDNKDLTDDIERLSPDIIILGGDMVNCNSKDGYDSMISLCRRLSETAPVYGVLGNHEDVEIFIKNDEELVSRFEKAGVTFLRNTEDKVMLYGNTVSLVGLEGKPEDFENYGAKECMDSLQEEDYDFRVCIAHVPTYFPSVLENYTFDLGLSGHVHGGIVQLPKLGPIYSAEEGFLPEYASGEYELSNGAPLIVSRGLGDSGWAPRINNIPELSVIDIS